MDREPTWFRKHADNENESGPLVTVVTCVYNGGAYLRPAVLSIVNQTYRNLEILIIDDGSTDGCIETIADIRDDRIRILQQENQGKPTAMNRALDEIQGEFFAIQDADDISHSHRIERQIEVFKHHPDVGGVFCGYELILNGRHVAPSFPFRNIDECSRRIADFRMPGHDATVMFRAAATVGLRYEPRLTVVDGHDFILQVGEHTQMMVLGDCLLSYRIHASMITQREGSRVAELTAEVVRRARIRRGYKPSKCHSKKPDICEDRKLRSLVAHFMESVVNLKEAGRRWQAIRTAICCWSLNPMKPYYYRPLAYAFTPIRMIQYYRRWKARTS